MNDNEKKGYYLEADYFQQMGSRHIENNEECQDSVLCSLSFPISIFGIADGQSKKRFSRLGGELALKVVKDYISCHGIECLHQIEYKDEVAYEIIREIRSILAQKAEETNTSIHEWASTLIVCAVDLMSGKLLTMHLGDGIILGVRNDGTISHLSSPENGIASSTWLTTSETALVHLRLSFRDISHYARLIIGSDGADSICRGNNVSDRVKKLLASGTQGDIIEYMSSYSYKDDSSLCVIDVFQNE